MSNGFKTTLLIVALGASAVGCDSKPPPSSTAPATFAFDKAPSESRGDSKNVQLGKATTRQTFDDSLNSKVVNQGKALSGSQVVGGAVDSGTK